MIIRIVLWVIYIAGVSTIVAGSECPTMCKCDEIKMDCSNVNLKKFPDQVPENTTVLNMVNSGLDELDRNALENYDDVQQLCLQLNNITKINSEIFKLMKSLRRLDISNNKISEVHKRAFTGLPELSGLILMGNNIDKMNGALSRTQGLTFLNLADNKLTEISEDEFAKLTKLKFLDLGSNLITKIHPKAFENLKHLRYLILQNNKITSLGVLSFTSRMLSVADFTKNALSRMPRGLPESVTDLRIGHNIISSIEKDDVSNMTRLQLLTLNGNNIDQIHDDAFERSKNLKEIWLTSNILTSLPKTWPAGLVKLFINSNKIKKIEQDAFKRNHHLKYLTLEMNELAEISVKSLSQLTSLEYLNLQGNQLAQLSKDVFTGMNSLQVLALANNPIANIEAKSFGNLSKLTRLDMSYNELANVKLHMDIFQAMPNLKDLNLMNSPGLSKGLLDQIQNSEMDPTPSVQMIDLRYNNLFSLPKEFQSAFPNLTILKLSSNAWHCDTELLWMKQWLASSEIKFYENEDERPACCTPFRLKGKPMMDVPDKDFLLIPEDDEMVITDNDKTGELDGSNSNDKENANNLINKGDNDLKTTNPKPVGVEINILQENNDSRKRRSRKKRRKASRKSHGRRSKKDRKKRKVSEKRKTRKSHQKRNLRDNKSK